MPQGEDRQRGRCAQELAAEDREQPVAEAREQYAQRHREESDPPRLTSNELVGGCLVAFDEHRRESGSDDRIERAAHLTETHHVEHTSAISAHVRAAAIVT
jgi:hypothetical protein